MRKANGSGRAPVHAVIIQADIGSSCCVQPERGVLMLPNGIAIDFGPGITRLSEESMSVVNNAATMLSWLQRTSG